MIKKLGVVTFGVAAGLMAAAPFASATECHESDHHEVESTSDSNNCNVSAGDVTGNAGSGALLGVGSALDGNANQILSCNDILNGNLSGNSATINL